MLFRSDHDGYWFASQIRRLHTPPPGLILLRQLSRADKDLDQSLFDRVINKPAKPTLLVRALAQLTQPRAPAPTELLQQPSAIQLSSERYVEMSAQEQVVLTVSVNGYGKRTSSYEYRTTGRGGKGIVAMSVNNRNGKLVASFPVEDSDQIMLVTDNGQLIRCPVEGIRIAGRSTQGVIVFDTAEDEHVVSVEHIGEDAENGNGNGGNGE